MSRYKRKTGRQLAFTEEKLEEVRRQVGEGKSKRSIAKEMGIPEATLRKRLKSGNIPKSLGRFNCDIPADLERELAQQIRHLDDRFYGVTKKNLQMAAYKFAESNNIQHRFNKNKKMAGESWVKGFCQRHNITLRQPEKCSMGRIIGFNKVQVDRFFTNLKTLYEKRQYSPSSIYNMDETGLSTVPNKLPKVMAKKGKKLVGKVTSADRGQLVTAVCCMSATGGYVPPALIFPRKRMKDELFLNAPTGTLQMISESGFINTELFCQWLVHFKNYTKPSEENPVLLILDNHGSHRDLQAIHFCRANHIDLLSLPPHASHKLQPLDVGFFSPLKSAYSRECDKWMINHPGKVITQMQVAGLFNIAYTNVANIQKAENAFKTVGIYPYNPDRFQDVDFVPSLVTEVPRNATEEDSPEAVNATEENSPEAVNCPATIDVTPPPMTNINNLEIVCEDGVIIPSTSETTILDVSVPASDILPFPKIQEKSDRKNRKSQKSEILSGTPFKNELEALENVKKEKENKKIERVKKRLSDTRPGPSKHKKNKAKANEDVMCPGCHDLYSKSDEDWIMCSLCNEWWHESCTTYVMGTFVCSNCEE